MKDTPFERRQHENTGKHQGNLKRSLRDLQNNHERAEREKQNAKAEVERLNRVVGGGGSASEAAAATTTVNSASIRKSAVAPQSAADRKRQWTQLAEMGIQVPNEFRAEMAMAGDWQTVSQQSMDKAQAEDRSSVGVRKRKQLDEQPDEEEVVNQSTEKRGWGSTTKRYPGQSDAQLDDLFGAKITVKKQDSGIKSELQESTNEINEDSRTELPNANGKKAVLEANNVTTSPTIAKMENNAGDENQTSSVKTETVDDQSNSTIRQIPETTPMPIFKKRKAKKGV